MFEDDIVFGLERQDRGIEAPLIFVCLFTARLTHLSNLVALLDVEHMSA